jgi:hypothetical protein
MLLVPVVEKQDADLKFALDFDNVPPAGVDEEHAYYGNTRKERFNDDSGKILYGRR